MYNGNNDFSVALECKGPDVKIFILNTNSNFLITSCYNRKTLFERMIYILTSDIQHPHCCDELFTKEQAIRIIEDNDGM